MIGIFEIIAMFIAGVITMPILTEGYFFYHEHRINKSYRQRLDTEKQIHNTRMQEMVRDWNIALEKYNKKLSKMKKKLSRQGLDIEKDEDSNDVVVKKIPVRMSFAEWLNHKKKKLFRGR